MKELESYNIEKLPFEGISKVSDLIELDGPILSHFKDQHKNNLLFYWVDHNEKYNRWLIWKVTEDQLHLYLSNQLPLSDIFAKDSDFVYSVDIDERLNFDNCKVILPSKIPAEYLPEQTSFYNFDYPDIYKEILSSLTYINTLRERSIYFYLKAKSNRYENTVGFNDVKVFFDNIIKSITEYARLKAYLAVKDIVTDVKRIEETVKGFSSPSRYRISYALQNSFEVGIAVDNLVDPIPVNDTIVQDLHKSILQKYQDEVLDNDFSSEHDIAAINERFSDETNRKRIFDPLIRIINNGNTQIEVSNFSKRFTKSYKRIGTKQKQLLSPPKEEDELTPISENVAIKLAYIKVTKTESGTLFPDDILGNILAEKDIDSYPLVVHQIDLEPGKVIKFKYQMDLNCAVVDNKFTLNIEPLGISLSEKSSTELTKKLESALRVLIQGYINGDQTYSSFLADLIPFEPQK